MSFKFECPSCQQRISADPQMRGSEASCPTCNAPLVVPAPISPLRFWPQSRWGSILLVVILSLVAGYLCVFKQVFIYIGFMYLFALAVRFAFVHFRKLGAWGRPLLSAPAWRHRLGSRCRRWDTCLALAAVAFFFIALSVWRGREWSDRYNTLRERADEAHKLVAATKTDEANAVMLVEIAARIGIGDEHWLKQTANEFKTLYEAEKYFSAAADAAQTNYTDWEFRFKLNLPVCILSLFAGGLLYYITLRRHARTNA